jgi:hypothetical protein
VDSEGLAVDPAWPADEAGMIETLVRRIRAADYGPHPFYDEKLCRKCDYLRVCRPRNDSPQPLGSSG